MITIGDNIKVKSTCAVVKLINKTGTVIARHYYVKESVLIEFNSIHIDELKECINLHDGYIGHVNDNCYYILEKDLERLSIKQERTRSIVCNYDSPCQGINSIL